MKESDLVKSCLELLAIKKIFHYRQNSGALKTDRGGFVRFGIIGAPDIIAVISGRYIGIECKASKYYKQSLNQKEFQEYLEESGGLYWLIRNIDELIDKLKNY